MRGGDYVSRINSMLVKESGTASNIKSRTNRQSVIRALTRVQFCLKEYGNKVPENGLAIFASADVAYQIQPIERLKVGYYRCDSRFHLEILRDMADPHYNFAYIILNNGHALFAEVKVSKGNIVSNILHNFKTIIDSNHSKGGQSAQRYDRRGMNQRQQFLGSVLELAQEHFNSDYFSGVIVAGPSVCKKKFEDYYSDKNSKLNIPIIGSITISNLGEKGLQEAISASEDIRNTYVTNKNGKYLSKFFVELYNDTDKSVYGEKETMVAINDGVAKCILVDKTKKDLVRYILENHADTTTSIVLLDKVTDDEVSFCENYQGIGCILRYSCSYYTN